MKGNRCQVKETGGSDAKSLMWQRVPAPASRLESGQ